MGKSLSLQGYSPPVGLGVQRHPLLRLIGNGDVRKGGSRLVVALYHIRIRSHASFTRCGSYDRRYLASAPASAARHSLSRFRIVWIRRSSVLIPVWSLTGSLQSMTRSYMALHIASKIQVACWFSVRLGFWMAPHSSAKIMSTLIGSFGGMIVSLIHRLR